MVLTRAAASRGKTIEMEDVKFHQCVRLARFESDRTISFIPPDGEFELMSYRISTPVKPLVWDEAAVEAPRGSRVEYPVEVKGQFKRRSTANNVEIFLPVPDDADSSKVWARLRRSPASCFRRTSSSNGGGTSSSRTCSRST
jgi:AP-1 complex subunit mu